jgi:hypothetical protein
MVSNGKFGLATQFGGLVHQEGLGLCASAKKLVQTIGHFLWGGWQQQQQGLLNQVAKIPSTS